MIRLKLVTSGGNVIKAPTFQTKHHIGRLNGLMNGARKYKETFHVSKTKRQPNNSFEKASSFICQLLWKETFTSVFASKQTKKHCLCVKV